MANPELSRRDFLKIAGLSLITACVPKSKLISETPTFVPNIPTPEFPPELEVPKNTPEVKKFRVEQHNDSRDVLFVNELSEVDLRLNWDKFEHVSDFFGFQQEHLRNFDIIITRENRSIVPTIGAEDLMVDTELVGKRGLISVAGGSLLESLRKPVDAPKETRDLFLSIFTGYSIFFGYSYLYYLRGYVKEDAARGMSLTYINMMYNALLPSIVEGTYLESDQIELQTSRDISPNMV